MWRLLRPGPSRLAALAALSPSVARGSPPAARPGPLGAPRRSAGSAAKDAIGHPEKAATDPGGENRKPNKSQQLKQVFKEYGAVGVSFHVGISLVSLGIFYLAVSSGVDMTAILFKLGFSESSLQSRMAAGTSTFVLAYAVHKLFAPYVYALAQRKS